MKPNRLKKFLAVAAALVCIAVLAACSRPGPAPTVYPTTAPPPSPEQATPSEAIPSPTPVPPSPTPAELAARVNGEGILLAEYQAELKQAEAAGIQDKQVVLSDLIDRTLLAQGAVKEGFQVTQEEVQARLDSLAEQMGGAQALDAWLQANGYDAATFYQAQERSMAAVWMRDRILSQTPKTAEQVHARQILLYKQEDAQNIFAQLQAGSNFENLAATVDPVMEGELGWFPRGYLPHKTLEDAIFSLQPGQTTPIIETPAGFHIVKLIERDPARPLEPDALQVLQAQALARWLDERRSESQIEALIP